jgi:Mor family transcriptional regulator
MFAELQELIGTEASDRLLANFPGRRIWVPSKITQGHPLAIVNSNLLTYYYGGCQIYVPKDSPRHRDQQLIKDWRSGHSVPEMMAQYRLSRSGVYRVLSRRVA